MDEQLKNQKLRRKLIEVTNEANNLKAQLIKDKMHNPYGIKFSWFSFWMGWCVSALIWAALFIIKNYTHGI